ncbi:MAG: NAD(P)H-binding protein [Bryobacteraceae bacterium]
MPNSLHRYICGSAGYSDVTKEAKALYSAIVLGATGNVGGRIVQLLIKNPRCEKAVVVTRRKINAFTEPKVSGVIVNMDRLEEEIAPHVQGVDVALAAFGVGKGSAKMPDEKVRKIEVAYPQAFCRAARAVGARVCGVMTAVGADPAAGMKYAKIIGEKEKAIESVQFDFLGVYRPAVVLGNSNTPDVLGYVMPLLHWAMASKYHSIHKNDLARAMVAQSEQAYFAIAQGNGPKKPTVKILEYKEMEPFFVKGESDEP